MIWRSMSALGWNPSNAQLFVPDYFLWARTTRNAANIMTNHNDNNIGDETESQRKLSEKIIQKPQFEWQYSTQTAPTSASFISDII